MKKAGLVVLAISAIILLPLLFAAKDRILRHITEPQKNVFKPPFIPGILPYNISENNKINIFRVSDSQKKTPLTIEFIIDPELSRSIPHAAAEDKLKETVEQASLVFNYQVGRGLEIKKTTAVIKLPAAWKEQILNADDILSWLKSFPKETDFIVFVSGRSLKNAISESSGGYAFISTPENKRRESAILYNSDAKAMKKILLHELGHNCGARHTDETGSGTDPAEESIMHSKITSDIKYDSKNLETIKENCG